MEATTHITRVEITERTDADFDGCFSVSPIWANVDRGYVGGYLATNRKLAERLARAMMAGAVYLNPEIHTDVNGQTYVDAETTVLGRQMNADLKRLGF